MSSKFKPGDRVVATFRPGWWDGARFFESEFHEQIAPGAVGHVTKVADDGDLYVDWGGGGLGYTSPDRVKLKEAAADPEAPNFEVGDRVELISEAGWYNGYASGQFLSCWTGAAVGSLGTVQHVDSRGDLQVKWDDHASTGVTHAGSVKLAEETATKAEDGLKVGDRVRVLPGARNEFGKRPWQVGREGVVRTLHGDGDVTVLADPSGPFDDFVVHRDYLEVLPREAEPEPDVPKFKAGDRVKILPGAYAFGDPVHDARPDLVGKAGVVELMCEEDPDGDVYVYLEGEGGRYVNIDFVELVDETTLIKVESGVTGGDVANAVDFHARREARKEPVGPCPAVPARTPRFTALDLIQAVEAGAFTRDELREFLTVSGAGFGDTRRLYRSGIITLEEYRAYVQGVLSRQP